MLSFLDSIIGESATAAIHHVPSVTIGEDAPINFGDYVRVDPLFAEILGTRFPRRVFNNTRHGSIPADLKEQLAWQASPAVDPRSLVPSSQSTEIQAFGIGVAQNEFETAYMPYSSGKPIRCCYGETVPDISLLPTLIRNCVDRRLREA